MQIHKQNGSFSSLKHIDIYVSTLKDNVNTSQTFFDCSEKENKIKSAMCEYYKEGHNCPYMHKYGWCGFAHGEHELREKKQEEKRHNCFDWTSTGSW